MTRSCPCDQHSYPLCCCALGLTGDALLDASRLASAIAGWPSGRLDAGAVEEHEARMRAARRAAKPRVPLGVKVGSAGCVACGK